MIVPNWSMAATAFAEEGALRFLAVGRCCDDGDEVCLTVAFIISVDASYDLFAREGVGDEYDPARLLRFFFLFDLFYKSSFLMILDDELYSFPRRLKLNVAVFSSRIFLKPMKPSSVN